MRSVAIGALSCVNEAVVRECSREDIALLEGTPVKTSLHQYYTAADYICGQNFDGNVLFTRLQVVVDIQTD